MPDLQLLTSNKGSFLNNALHFISQMTLRGNASHKESLRYLQSQDEENPPWGMVCFRPSPLSMVRGNGSHKRPAGREAKQELGRRPDQVRLLRGPHMQASSPWATCQHPELHVATREGLITTTSGQMLPENNPLVGLRPDSDSGEPNFPYKAPSSKLVRAC